MKRYFALTIALSIPSFVFAELYQGTVSYLDLDDSGSNMMFEIVNRSNDKCQSSWFSISKLNKSELSAGDLVFNSYFSKNKISIESAKVCADRSSPSAVTRASVGTTNSDRNLEIKKYQEYKKDKK